MAELFRMPDRWWVKGTERGRPLRKWRDVVIEVVRATGIIEGDARKNILIMYEEGGTILDVTNELGM